MWRQYSNMAPLGCPIDKQVRRHRRHDALVAALIFGAPHSVALSVINGRVVVRDGHLATIELPRIIEQHNRLSRELVSGNLT